MAMKADLLTYLRAMIDQGASDLHLSVGAPPQYRIHGSLVKVKAEALTPQETKDLTYSVLTDVQKADFERKQELDFSFGLKELARFRANIFMQKGSIAAVFRLVPIEIPDFDALGVPKVLRKVIRKPNGLILITGPTGCGKSTTIAALLDIINRETHGHIITFEDPIEYLHTHKKCLINQREVGADTRGFKQAIRRALRQDPDYVLVGELRDTETMSMALTMSETGHLVFATLHTNGAIQSINRIVNSFPPHQQDQVRNQLSFVIQGIMSQQLLRKSFEQGRVLATEILIPTLGIRNLIRSDKLHQVYASMQSGQEETYMQTMNQSLYRLVLKGQISQEKAIESSPIPEELIKMFENSARSA